MAPTSRRNSALLTKISSLQLRLAPLVPLPSGPPHPAFPKTLMAFHLLTEDELDSIAHYYHQSTPGPWTDHYPAKMNWDKEFLARPSPKTPCFPSTTQRRQSRQFSHDDIWLEDLSATVEDLQSPTVESQAGAGNPYADLTNKQRIRIKRRKVGKFIGLMGMETPVEEIGGTIRASFDRAVARSRAELRRNEEIMLRRRKMV